MSITAKMVQELRDATGAKMMDCKRALETTRGDFQGAVDQLRKQGVQSAAKTAGRSTGEGRLCASIEPDSRRGHMIGISCETDFLASSAGFRELVVDLQEHAATQDPDGIEDGARPLLKQSLRGAGPSVAETIQAFIAKCGENVRVTQLVRLENKAGRIGAYVHHDNKQGALVSVTSAADASRAESVLKALCQHIVVFAPSFATREAVPSGEVEREKAIARETDEIKKKPVEFHEKILAGKLEKFFAGIVLEEQPWIFDDKTTVRKALEKELGPGTRVAAFARVRIGA